MSSTHLLFVYGTLRRGFRHHGQLRGARFLGVVRTRPGYALVDFGPYPGLVEGARAIVGELYAVPSALVPALDAFEGDEYARGDVVLEDGRVAEAYLVRPEHRHRARPLAVDSWSPK
ncbi:MAG TPA: gamma-glutamylcyclotransferase family protein [Polyangiaceae bacterium]|nr:gamma-glutamylcyclotransferase family protein [Polyangiaceae bacterium]